MNRKRAIIGAILAGVVLGLLAAGVASYSRAERDLLAFEREEIDLGGHPVQSTVPCEVPFQNTSAAAIKIEEVEGGCSCAEVSFPEELIAPGGKGVLSLLIRIDRLGPYRIEPRIRLAGLEEPIRLAVRFVGFQALQPTPPVVYLTELTKEHAHEVTIRWALHSDHTRYLQGRWFADTAADFVRLGQPRITGDEQQTYVVVPATVMGFLTPEELFRVKVTLFNEFDADLEGECLLIGQAKQYGLVFDPPSVLVGRIGQASGILRRPVRVRLRSRQAFELATVGCSDAAVGVGPTFEKRTWTTLYVSIDPRKISELARWSAEVPVSTKSGIKGTLRVYGFVQSRGQQLASQ